MILNKQIRAKLYAYAIGRLGLREYRRGWLKGVCPSCGRYDKYGLNIGMNRTNCFVCGYHPSPINVVIETEGLSTFREAWSYLKAYEGREYLEPIIERIERIDTVLPEGFKSLGLGKGRLGRTARKYIESRRFDVEEMIYKGWGYGTRGVIFGILFIHFYPVVKIFFNML